MKLSDYKCFGIKIERDCDFEFLAKVSDPVEGRFVTFLLSENYLPILAGNKNAAAVITSSELVSACISLGIGVAVADFPKKTFIDIHNNIAKNYQYKESIIGSNCTISKLSDISSKGVVIGNNVIVEDYVKIYPGVVVDDDCKIHSGSILGCQNYEHCRDENGHYVSANHIGHLMIGKRVTIGENAKIDKALFSWDSTIIGDDCFIGRGSDIGHGCKIGEQSSLIANVSVCGYVTIGKRTQIGSGALISNRLKIGIDAIISIGSVVTKDIADKQRVSGNFAIEHKDFISFIKSISSK